MWTNGIFPANRGSHRSSAGLSLLYKGHFFRLGIQSRIISDSQDRIHDWTHDPDLSIHVNQGGGKSTSASLRVFPQTDWMMNEVALGFSCCGGWCVCVCVRCGRDIKSRTVFGGFSLIPSPAMTAALWRNDNNIHHLTGHLFRQDRTTIQGGRAGALCVCAPGRLRVVSHVKNIDKLENMDHRSVSMDTDFLFLFFCGGGGVLKL